jgi:DNA anti-recombination protein RmuC
MWQSFLFWINQLIFAGRELQDTRAEIRQMQQEAKEISAMMGRILLEIQRLHDSDHSLQDHLDTVRSDMIHEREKMLLQLENELLKFERRLPRAGEKE